MLRLRAERNVLINDLPCVISDRRTPSLVESANSVGVCVLAHQFQVVLLLELLFSLGLVLLFSYLLAKESLILGLFVFLGYQLLSLLRTLQSYHVFD